MNGEGGKQGRSSNSRPKIEEEAGTRNGGRYKKVAKCRKNKTWKKAKTGTEVAQMEQ